MSTPTGTAPRAAAAAATYPGPVATSSTRMPAPTPAASNSGSTKRAVIAPVTRPYDLARRDHPAASNALNSSAPLAITVTLTRRRQRRAAERLAPKPGRVLDAALHSPATALFA